jgi:hypothetical protein
MAELHPPGAGGYKISRGGVHVSLTRTRGPDDTPNAWGLSRSGGAGKDLARALALRLLSRDTVPACTNLHTTPRNSRAPAN